MSHDTPLSPLLQRGETSIMCGVVGSTAHGLATEASDVDRLGVHIADTDLVLGLNGHASTTATRTSTDPDGTSHEIGKFCTLDTAPACVFLGSTRLRLANCWSRRDGPADALTSSFR